MSRTHAAIDVPAATRAQPPGWRDPRLWIGVAIVAVSIVAGARIVGGADDSVGVWAATRDVAPGDTVREGDLVSRSVRFADPADLDRYLLASEPLPDEVRVVRGLGAGELVPAAALGSSEDAETIIVSLAFPNELIPTNIGAGSVIELLVIPEQGSGQGERSAEPNTVMSDVVVIDAPSGADSFGGGGGSRQLVLGIDEAESEALTEVLAASEDQRVRVLVRG